MPPCVTYDGKVWSVSIIHTTTGAVMPLLGVNTGVRAFGGLFWVSVLIRVKRC